MGFTTFRVAGLYNEFGVAVPLTAYALPLITIGFGTLLWVVYMIRRLAEKIVISLVILGAIFLFGLLAYFLVSGYIGGKQVENMIYEYTQ